MSIYLGNKSIELASLGSIPVQSILDVRIIPAIPTASLVFWLDATSFTTGSGTWSSNYGIPYSATFNGATPVQKREDNGGVVNFTTSSALVLGAGGATFNYTTASYTLFVATRYSGSSTDRHGRLLEGRINNWLAPTYGGGGAAGSTEYHSAYYNASTFIIQSGSIYDTEWRISTVVRDIPNLSSSFYVNGVIAATGAPIKSSTAGN